MPGFATLLRSFWLVIPLGALAGCDPSVPTSKAGAVVADDGCTELKTTAGTMRQCRYAESGLPARDYYVYVPALSPQKSLSLVIYLHGCNQNAVEGAIQTRWNALADEGGFVVAYPEQRVPAFDDIEGQVSDGNGVQCWNWFSPAHLHRGSGEPATLAGITQALMRGYPIDPKRIFLMGTSGGGAMTAVMGATYPELYAALAINSGAGYPVATDPSGTLAAREMGERIHRMPVIVFHGTADEAAAFPLGVGAVRQWLGTNDFADDGAVNGSVPQRPAATEHHGLDASLLTGIGNIGDLCVGNRVASPCLGGALGFAENYPYSVEHYVDAAGRPLLDFWIIHLLTHNYVGGDPSVNFSDPLGPDITRAARDFFFSEASLAD